MRSGSTLLELLVVLVLLASTTAVVVPSLPQRRSEANRAALELQELMQWSLLQAARRGENARIVIDATTASFWIGAASTWPRDIWRQDALGTAAFMINGGSRLEFDVGQSGSVADITIEVTHGTERATVEVLAGSMWPALR